MEHPAEYYKLNRFILKLIGLWPYQSKWSARLVRAVITIVLLSSTFFQLSSIFTSDITVDFIVDVIPALIPTFGSLSHVYARVRHVDKLRDLFEHMWKDWRLQKTRYEMKIMREHAETTRLLTFYYLLLQYIVVIVYIIWMFMPEILDVISPMNESRPRMQPFKAEFFVDEEQYFYFIRSHTCLVILIMPLIFLTTSSLFVALTQHACGMCKLLGYRAERLFCVVKSATGCDLTRSKISCGNMVVFIRLHYNIIQFIDMIQIYHTIPFLMDLLGLVLAVSLALTQMLTIGGDIERAFRSTGIAIVALIYLFVSNYMGQKVTDLSSSVCEKVYNSEWYNADVSEQKSLLLIIKRRFNPLVLTACRFYVMSLPKFGMILQTVISYCMFMRQL
ncbi:uncharacterized protein [Temnothorax longispinosus]|uniref:uncharacterized protein n=1 Tax=Temnothorax longispinosus TaxID=300112 RepID=UPI003A99C260